MCRSLLNSILPHCQRNSEHRNILVGTQLLAKLECLNGRYGNVIALLTQCGSLLEQISDSTLFSTHVLLLSKAYYEIELLSEAIQTSQNGLIILDDAMTIQIADIRPESSKAKRTSNMSTTVSQGGHTVTETGTLHSG